MTDLEEFKKWNSAQLVTNKQDKDMQAYFLVRREPMKDGWIAACELKDKDISELRAELTKMSLNADMQRDTESMLRAELERNLESIRQGNDIITRLRTKLDAMKNQKPVVYAQLADNGNIRMWTKEPAGKSWKGIFTSLYSRPVPAIPEGMMLVPIDPTPEMKSRALDVETEDYCLSWEEIAAIYKAMIAAAQKGGVE